MSIFKTSKYKKVEDRKKSDKENLLKALRQCLGVVTTACEMVGLSRTTYYKFLEEDPEFAQEVKELEEVALDFGESQLYKNMRAGHASSTIFFLKTKGRKRGFIEKREIEAYGKDGKPLYSSNPYALLTDDELDEQLESLDDDDADA